MPTYRCPCLQESKPAHLESQCLEPGGCALQDPSDYPSTALKAMDRPPPRAQPQQPILPHHAQSEQSPTDPHHFQGLQSGYQSQQSWPGLQPSHTHDHSNFEPESKLSQFLPNSHLPRIPFRRGEQRIHPNHPKPHRMDVG